MPLQRVAFSPDETDALAAFCVANGSPFDARLVGHLLRDLTSDPAGVLVLADEMGPAAVATVVDRISNAAGAADLEILGARVRLSERVLIEQVVAPAVAFARAGLRLALHISLHDAMVDGEAAKRGLLASGWVPAYDTFHMRRGADAPELAAPDAPAEGWRWTVLDEGWAAAAHAAISEAFEGQASLGLPPLDDFRRAIAAGHRVSRLLLHGTAIAGFVQVVPRGARGDVALLGRSPHYRGRGLGVRLIRQGLRLLHDAGAREVDLTVEAQNDRALALYRRFDFRVIRRTPVLGLALR